MRKIALFILIACCTSLDAQVSSFGFKGWVENLVKEPTYFHAKSSVFQVGFGIISNAKLKEQALLNDGFEAKLLSPSLNLTFEKNIWNNLGLGITLANQNWQVPDIGYKYLYFSGGLRATYHLNVADFLDTYLGVVGTYSRMHLTNDNFNVFNQRIHASFIFGTRYYFKDKMGIFLEIGNDGLALMKSGLSFYFN